MGVKKRDILSVSPWIRRFSHLIQPGGRVLDLAAGSGRHSAWFLERGHHLTAVDRQVDALATLADSLEHDDRQRFQIIEADLETGEPWTFVDPPFDAVVVVNYLHRPRFPDLVEALAPGGLLLYETFAVGQEAYGKPSNPDFLLRPGELLDAVRGRLQIVAYEHGLVDSPSGPAVKQRLAAIFASAPCPLR